MQYVTSLRKAFLCTIVCAALLCAATAAAQTPSPALLVLEKSDDSLAIVDPGSLRIVARIPAGQDPHEIVASADGKVAYISNYGGVDSTFDTISVADLVAQKALPPINLGALRSAHGLAFAGGKVYFTAETNKAIGRYDPATQQIDWVLGTGQDRTHMVDVLPGGDRIVTSNVMSGTLSIIELTAPTGASYGPAPGGLRKTWRVTNVPSGRGSEGFDVSPDGKMIWAANAQDATVTVIDVTSKKATETFPVSIKGNRLKFTVDGKRALISGQSANGGGPDLVVLDVFTQKEIKQIDLGGSSGGILVTPDGSRAFISVSAKDKVAVLDLKTLEITAQIPTGRQPDGLAWAQRR